MKKGLIGVLCTFVIATLFSFSTNVVFANSTDSNSAKDVLDTIISQGKKRTYEQINDEGIEVMEPYTAFTVKDTVAYIDADTGYVVAGGKSYYFEITTSGGNVVTSNTTFASDENGYYNIELNETQLGEEEYYIFSLISIEGDETISNKDEATRITAIDEGKVINLNETGKEGFWEKVAHLLVEILCGITLPAGDSYLYMISSAIGEPVTIDKVVFNDVQKLSIDFFDGTDGEIVIEDSDSGDTSTIMPIKNILKDTINTWYTYFRNLVLMLYMAILVYLGIKILLASTANKKAMYKNVLTAWVMGIAMLMFFPYVMKYAIKLNDALCQAVHKQGSSSANTMGSNVGVSASFLQASKLYGKDGFIMLMLGSDYADASDKTQQNNFAKTAVSSGVLKGDAMLNIRFVAANTGNFMLVIVYFILIGELLAILVIYYKRVFMLAFLITIFPIVMATYPFSKIGDIKVNAFGVWFKEFLINVFVQSFHAVTYVVVVTVGIDSYFTDSNWLFMIMCILFLFEGEKIIRGIFGAKSSINSIGDMAAAGMMAASIVRGATKFMPTLGDKKGDKNDNANGKAAADRKAARENPGANTPGAQANASAINSITNGANEIAGNVAENTGIQLGREPGVTNASANAEFEKRSSKATSKFDKVAGAIGGGVSAVSQVAGGMAGFTFGMAQNDGRGPSGIERGLTEATRGAEIGKTIGMGAYNVATGVVGRTVGTVGGLVLANKYSKGEYDDEIFTDADKALDEAQKEALRKAYAQAARRKGAGFDNSAEIKIMKARVEQSKK